jgi:hypothetical protein
MAYINVDVDLDEFDLDDLLDELEDRYSYKQNKETIEDFAKDLLNVKVENNLSLIDQLKIDFLINNLEKISINDLESLLK